MKGQTWSEREEVRKENWQEKRRNNFNTGQKDQCHHRTRRNRKGQRWAKRTGSWQDEKSKVIGRRKERGHRRTKSTRSSEDEKNRVTAGREETERVSAGQK